MVRTTNSQCVKSVTAKVLYRLVTMTVLRMFNSNASSLLNIFKDAPLNTTHLTLKTPNTTTVICLYAKSMFEKFARRRHKQTTFSDAGFLGALRVNCNIVISFWFLSFNVSSLQLEQTGII